VSTFEEVEAEHVVAEPTLHMLKATTLSATWKAVVEPFRPILHILNETLHQVTPDRRRDAPNPVELIPITLLAIYFLAMLLAHPLIPSGD